MKKKEPIESIITIREKHENGVVTRSIEENGELYYSQTKPVYLMHKGTQTFLDDFIDRFSTCFPVHNELENNVHPQNPATNLEEQFLNSLSNVLLDAEKESL